MKKTILLLSLAFLFIILGCKANAQAKPITFSGVITNPPDRTFRIRKLYTGTAEIVPIAKDGSFKITLNTGTGIYLFHEGRGRNEVYLVEGTDVKFTADGGDRNKLYASAQVTGDYQGASRYLLTRYNHYMSLRGNNSDFYNETEADFLKKQRKLTADMNDYLNSFEDTPEEFLVAERKDLHYDYLYNLLAYDNNQRKEGNAVSANFLDEFKGVDMANQEDFVNVRSYEKLVLAYYVPTINKLTKEGVNIYIAKIKTYGTIPNEYIKNDLINSIARKIGSAKDLDEFYNTFISNSTSESNNRRLKVKYEELQKISSGKASPTFVDYVNHAGGKTSLSDLKGKYIYVDVWATWCAPCLKELPSLKKVEEQYHGKNIQFLSISVDTEKAYEKWVKMVNDKEMGGIQLFADNSFKSDFMVAYGISAIPRFLLIDPEGKIVSPNAPRPSDSKLIDLFNDLKI